MIHLVLMMLSDTLWCAQSLEMIESQMVIQASWNLLALVILRYLEGLYGEYGNEVYSSR